MRAKEIDRTNTAGKVVVWPFDFRKLSSREGHEASSPHTLDGEADPSREAESRRWMERTHPFPEGQPVAHLDITLSRGQFETLSRGIIPRGMEDRWLICVDGHFVVLYRSWTGCCAYRVHFRNNGPDYVLDWALVNLDQHGGASSLLNVEELQDFLQDVIGGRDDREQVAFNLLEGIALTKVLAILLDVDVEWEMVGVRLDLLSIAAGRIPEPRPWKHA